MKILIIAISGSVHTSKWINQLKDSEIEVSLFSSTYDLTIHSDLSWVKAYYFSDRIVNLLAKRFSRKKRLAFYKGIDLFRERYRKNYQQKRLRNCIKQLKPDLIHSLETQAAGYLVSDVKEKYYQKRSFPLWWHSNWGSDIYLFGRIPTHQEKIKQVLQNCDFYSCECFRDIELALKSGFKGKLLPVYPNAGGFDLEQVEKIREQVPKSSKRRLILLKGYQGWAGRALVGFRALERCADILAGYEIYIYSNTDASDIQIAASLFTNSTQIPVTLVPEDTPHYQILELQGQSRISIGLSISDGISTSLLEAMVMGAFPIQSYTACASEWFEDGVSGIIVPPEDPEIIEQAIRKTISDNELVDKAAELNYATIRLKADYKLLQQQTIKIYQDILSQKD